MYNFNFRRGCWEILCFLGLCCYRSNIYVIIIVLFFGKKNFVGVMLLDNGRVLLICVFDCLMYCDLNFWGNNNFVMLYI